MKRNAYFAICSSLAVLPVRRTASPGIDSLRPASRPSSRRDGSALELEEHALRLESAGVPAEAAVARQDAVAGHHDGDRVRAERLARGARGLLASRLRRDLRVRADVAERDARGRAEDASLERSQRREVHGDVERLPPSRE